MKDNEDTTAGSATPSTQDPEKQICDDRLKQFEDELRKKYLFIQKTRPATMVASGILVGILSLLGTAAWLSMRSVAIAVAEQYIESTTIRTLESNAQSAADLADTAANEAVAALAKLHENIELSNRTFEFDIIRTKHLEIIDAEGVARIRLSESQPDEFSIVVVPDGEDVGTGVGLGCNPEEGPWIRFWGDSSNTQIQLGLDSESRLPYLQMRDPVGNLLAELGDQGSASDEYSLSIISHGAFRAVFGVDRDAGFVSLLDIASRDESILRQSKDGSFLGFRDRRGFVRASVSYDRDHNTSALRLFDSDRDIRSYIGLNHDNDIEIAMFGPKGLLRKRSGVSGDGLIFEHTITPQP